MPRGRRRAGPRRPVTAAHRGPRALEILAEAHPGQAGDGRHSPMTQGCAINRPFGPEPLPLESRAPAVLRSQGSSRAPPILLLSACSTLPAATSFCPQYILTTRKAARRVHDSLLHDSGLGAAATISAGLAGREAPGGRRARRACTGICLHACLLRAAARGGLPGMHWDLPACTNPAGWLAGRNYRRIGAVPLGSALFINVGIYETRDPT